MRSICDYILRTDRRCFEIVIIRGVRNYPSYHFALRARLIICPMEAGHHCLKSDLQAIMGAVNGGRDEDGS